MIATTQQRPNPSGAATEPAANDAGAGVAPNRDAAIGQANSLVTPENEQVRSESAKSEGPSPVLERRNNEQRHERLRHDAVEAMVNSQQNQLQQPGAIAAVADPTVDANAVNSLNELMELQRSKKKKKGSRPDSSVAQRLRTVVSEEALEYIFDKVLSQTAQVSALSPEQVSNIARELHRHTQDLMALLALDGRHTPESILANVAEELVELSRGRLTPADGLRIADEQYQREMLTKVFSEVQSLTQRMAVRSVSTDEQAEQPSKAELERVMAEYDVFLDQYPHFREIIESFATQQYPGYVNELRLVIYDAIQSAWLIEGALLGSDPQAALRTISDALTVKDTGVFLLSAQLVQDSLGQPLPEHLHSKGPEFASIAHYMTERSAGNPQADQAAALYVLAQRDLAFDELRRAIESQQPMHGEHQPTID